MDTRQQIISECNALKETLLRKNEAYGDSALDPVRVFSKADPVEQLRIRLDDKLSRLVRGQADGEDVTLDLLGYLILLRIAERRKQATAQERIDEILENVGVQQVKIQAALNG